MVPRPTFRAFIELAIEWTEWTGSGQRGQSGQRRTGRAVDVRHANSDVFVCSPAWCLGLTGCRTHAVLGLVMPGFAD